MRDEAFSIRVAFQKSNENTGRFVRGWASVASVNGEDVTDWENDVTTVTELRKAAHQFIRDARVSKMMHEGSQIGDVVESVIIDDDFAKAVGMSDGKRGWWIGVEVTDAGVQKRVRDGELTAFSLGGTGRRKAIAE